MRDIGLRATTEAGAGKPAADVVTPVPLPDSPTFPVATATIDGWIAAGDTAAIRGHAWSLWQGMAAPSGQTFNGQMLPIWETWAGPNDVFPTNQAAVAAGATYFTTMTTHTDFSWAVATSP